MRGKHYNGNKKNKRKKTKNIVILLILFIFISIIIFTGIRIFNWLKENLKVNFYIST